MFWKEPLIHFFVLGLVVFGLHTVFEKKPETADDPFLIEVTSADIEWFRTMWSKRMGREPTIEELRGQVDQSIREQVLSREAVSMGLDKGDLVVRRRLAQKVDFLFKELSDITEPSDSELQALLQEKHRNYEIPAHVKFTHIYFNSDERGEKEAAEAIRLLIERLNFVEEIPSDLSNLGDPFLLPSGFSDKSLVEVQRRFGPGFAESIWKQPVHTWHGPIYSGYGMHAVYIHDRTDAALPGFDAIKQRLKTDWMAEKQAEASRNAYESLRKRYRVFLEGMPYELDMSG